MKWANTAPTSRRHLRLSCIKVALLLLLTLVMSGDGLSFSNRFMPPSKTVPAASVPAASAANGRFRGTTVPTGSASNLLQKAQKTRRHREVNSIDPSDPYTFGYAKIGKLLGAHGVRGEVKLLLDADSDSHRMKKGGVVYVKKPTRRSPRAVRVLSSRRQGSVEGKQVVFLAQLEGVSTRTAAEAFKQYELYIRDDSFSETQGRDEYMIRELVGLRCYLWSELASAGVPISAVSSGDHASRGSEGQTAPNVRTDPPELSLDKVLLDTIGALSPVAVVVGVVPPEELCDSPAAARLMHAQLEVQLLFPEPRPRSPLPAAGSVSGKLAAISTATAPPRRRKALYCLVPLVPSIVRCIDLPSGVLVLDPPDGLLSETYELSERVGPIKGFLPAHVAALSAADRAYLAERVTTVSS